MVGSFLTGYQIRRRSKLPYRQRLPQRYRRAVFYLGRYCPTEKITQFQYFSPPLRVMSLRNTAYSRNVQECYSIFVFCLMTNFVGLQHFYKTVSQSLDPVPQDAGHFNIFKVEDLILPATQPHYSRRNFFKISLVTGLSKIHYADRCIEVLDSALVFTNPMLPYYWERISEHHSGFVCIFTEAFFHHFGSIKDYPVFQRADAAVIALSPELLHTFSVRFHRIYNELQNDYPYKYDLIRSLLTEVIHSAQQLQPITGMSSGGSNASARIAGLFAELLERQFPIGEDNQVMQLSTPAAFAGRLNLHVNHLNKALKGTTGQTTSQLINERIMQEARILLKSTGWAVNEIAWSLGFKEPNHFSSFFRARAGITPKQFRQAGD